MRCAAALVFAFLLGGCVNAEALDRKLAQLEQELADKQEIAKVLDALSRAR